MKRSKITGSMRFTMKCWKNWIKSVHNWYGNDAIRFYHGSAKEALDQNGAQLIAYVNKWRRKSLESIGIL